ncbi:MAG: hypothetical protein H0U74_18110 [Bradymonadaceae bacterium]|nr:hypothetical protein [Lujinxingiaceae bacterium]
MKITTASDPGAHGAQFNCFADPHQTWPIRAWGNFLELCRQQIRIFSENSISGVQGAGPKRRVDVFTHTVFDTDIGDSS